MEQHSRALAGSAMAFLVVLAGLACSVNTTPPDEGPVQIEVRLAELQGSVTSDADTARAMGQLASIDVYLVAIRAARTADTADAAESKEWETILSPRKRFDLLKVGPDISTLIGNGNLPGGRFSIIAVTIDPELSRVVALDGSVVPVDWGGSGEMTIHALVEMLATGSETATRLLIDFDPRRTFRPDGSGGLFFVPWIRAIQQGN